MADTVSSGVFATMQKISDFQNIGPSCLLEMLSTVAVGSERLTTKCYKRAIDVLVVPKIADKLPVLYCAITPTRWSQTWARIIEAANVVECNDTALDNFDGVQAAFGTLSATDLESSIVSVRSLHPMLSVVVWPLLNIDATTVPSARPRSPSPVVVKQDGTKATEEKQHPEMNAICELRARFGIIPFTGLLIPPL